MTASDVRARVEAAPAPGRPSRGNWPSLAVALLALLVGFLATRGLWGDLAGRVIAGNVPDATHYSWWLAHTPHALGEGRSPLFTEDMNWPTGVSAMNNTTLLLPSVLLWPITALWGSLATLNVLNVLAVPACWAGMYWSLRRLPAGAPAVGPAAVGATAYAISPAVVNSLVGHVTMAFAPLLPVLVLLSVKAWTSARPARVGLVLGLVAAVQVVIGEEVLFQAGAGALLVLVVCALSRPRAVRAGARRLAISLGAAFAVFLPLVGYPLYVQFLGRLHQSGNPFLPDYYGTDLFSFLIPTDGLWLHNDATSAVADGYPGGIEEHLAYVGLPLAVTGLALVLFRPRSLPARAAAVGLLVAGVLALGGRLWIDGVWTETHGPYYWLHKLPVVEASLATRFGMLVALFSAALLAFAVQAVLGTSAEGRWARARPWLAAGLALACLAPLAPRPLEVVDAAEVPGWFTNEARDLPAGTVVMVLPYPVPVQPVAMRWQAEAGFPYRMPGGYFIGPAFDGKAYLGGDADPATARLLAEIQTGETAVVGDDERRQARQDLTSLGVDMVVLGPDYYRDGLQTAVTQLLGYEPTEVDGVSVWDRPLERMAGS